MLPHALQFLHDHLRMEDVRLYLLDVLIEYAALQRFQPRPLQESICYTGERALLWQRRALQGGAAHCSWCRCWPTTMAASEQCTHIGLTHPPSHFCVPVCRKAAPGVLWQSV